jgi:hypothetical protein
LHGFAADQEVSTSNATDSVAGRANSVGDTRLFYKGVATVIPTALPIHVHIETARNDLGIDQARLTLTDAVRQRLRQLCEVMASYGLLAVKFDDLPVHWYKGGERQNEWHSNTCELVGNADHQDLTLYVNARFPGVPDARGVFGTSVNVQGHWFFGVVAALDDSSLYDAADENDVIAATYDWYDPTNDWPNPFLRFSTPGTQRPAVHVLLPAVYTSTPRSAVADAVLTELLQTAVDLELNPDSRCVLYTLAAAICLCPDEVRLTRDVSDIPPFLRPQDLQDSNEAPLTQVDLVERVRICGTCEWVFSKSQKTLYIRYQGLEGRLVLNGGQVGERWSASHNVKSLSIEYNDHGDNEFAWHKLREFLPQYADDHSRLKILAFGLDALLQRLAPKRQCWEDLRAWLETDGGYFGNGKGVEI